MKQSKTLREAFPEIAAEWHPTKNGDLTPDQVSAKSSKKVWWLLHYRDPKTGREFDFEWEARIVDRTGGYRCPYLSRHKLMPGFNDLETVRPDLAAQWHPTKNGDLKPDRVAATSTKMVWWLQHYMDPLTGKEFDFEWKAVIRDRNLKNSGCPYLSGNKVWPGYNDLTTTHPDIAAQWHPTKNGDLTAQDVSAGSNRKVWWNYPYNDPETGRHFDFEWSATVSQRTNDRGCPYLSGKAVWPGYNDLTTTHPDMAAQWHPTKNGKLTPQDVSAGSSIAVWWHYPYDDLTTGQHYDFEWQQIIKVRTREGASECPYLSNTKVRKGFNDLSSVRPDIAAQWHPTKNGDITPDQVFPGSNMMVWWILPYDDPVTGKHFEFEWEAKVYSRTSLETGCPYLTNDAVWPGYNDLATHYPELAAQWHPTKNYGLTPDKVLAGGGQWGWWIYPYDDPETGNHHDFVWLSTVQNRINNPACPFLKNKGVWTGYNDLHTCFPEIAAQWHPQRNRTTPDKVMKYSHKNVWWKCEHGHEWRTSVASRTRRGTGCPKCNKIRRRYGSWTD